MVFSTLIKLFLFYHLLHGCDAKLSPIIKDLHESKDLQLVLIDMLNGQARRHDVTCVVVICDTVYLNVFDGAMFKRILSVPMVMIVVEEYEDLLSPNFDTLESLREARMDGCNIYIILLANGLQVSRLLRFGDRYRILDTRAKYVMLHDYRLFHSDLHYIWKRIVNVIFLRYHRKITGVLKSKAWFDLSTVPFPNPIKTVFVSRRVDIWKNGRFHYNRTLFADKTSNLNGEALNVVYFDHAPSVVIMKMNDSSKVSGVEIEILNTLSQQMNFKPKLYQPNNIEVHKWGQKLANGTFSGLLGEMVNGKADVALGNLQYNPYHLELTDLSIPYTSQCWTFLTPEALTDNSWKTLILPFKLYMWIAVLLVLLITGIIFYGLAKYYMNLQELKKEKPFLESNKNIEKQEYVFEPSEKPVGLYLFGEIINSILYTYGMLLVVSLPKLPTGWSIRLLTGWYWLYCILLVVSYRASMTAILANPAPRVTIDTIKELVDSKVTCGGWGVETKKFFEKSTDETQKIGDRFELVDEPFEAANKIAKGVYAYYDNKDFLKYLSVKRKNSLINVDKAVNATINDTDIVSTDTERNLHIMTDCVVNIPISIGFHKNSPLKPLADIYLARIVEVGLVEKWLNDAMNPIRVQETNENEIKALMNLKKLYGAFIALAIGYILSLIGLIGELIHWHCVVKRDPQFDKYALDVYYAKNKKQ
ncbi:glutamate receptor ionotropic, kainate glr-3 isoform X1 [Plodia interpunctella]|uniref:glutamate receptor ionotropic, kainate glr-3 isoform X1 n=1 Tax=Plodia interpunctella TaxID=58824 RepID=UPI002368ADDA|nr:glutamate receptor ionotropic, kainate glr-3 isoform X1 [Plodia interpunctella]